MKLYKKVAVVLLVLFLSGASLMAQDAGKNPFKYVSFDAGLRVGMELDSSDIALARYFSFNISLSDSFSFAYVNIGGSGAITDYNLLKFELALASRIGFSLSAGAIAANVVYGVGLYYRLSEGGESDGIKTGIFACLDFLKTENVDGGTLLLGISTRFGY